MADIVVPDFKSSEDFVQWSKGLSEQEIQGWTAKDWNKMFEKIDNFVSTDSEIQKAFLQRYPNTASWSAEEVFFAKRRMFLENQDNVYALGKCYQNYRFEKKPV